MLRLANPSRRHPAWAAAPRSLHHEWSAATQLHAPAGLRALQVAAAAGGGGRRLHTAAAAAAAGATAPPAPATPPAHSSGSGGAAPAATHFQELVIRDFALVEEQRVQLAPGLTVITGELACALAVSAHIVRFLPGLALPPVCSDPAVPCPHPCAAAACAPPLVCPAGESGAGKSVLVEALGQLLGAAAYDEAVRPPATTASLEATLAVAPADQAPLRALLLELGLPQKAARQLDRLQLRRELSRGPDGSIRSRCLVNGSPAPGALACPPLICCCRLLLALALAAGGVCSKQRSPGLTLPPRPAALLAPAVRALREVGQLLVDVNGQHAALSLKDPATRVRSRQHRGRAHGARGRGNGCQPARRLLAACRPRLARRRLSSHPTTTPPPPPPQQLRLLDRVAGTTAVADAFAALQGEWQAAAAQLRELDALGDEEQRGVMQQLVDEVRCGCLQ